MTYYTAAVNLTAVSCSLCQGDIDLFYLEFLAQNGIWHQICHATARSSVSLKSEGAIYFWRYEK